MSARLGRPATGGWHDQRMTITRTHTRTYAQHDAWASTLPWPAGSGHNPEDGQPCAIPDCDHHLHAGEECYAVTDLPRTDKGEQWVCWRHVRADDGPIRVA